MVVCRVRSLLLLLAMLLAAAAICTAKPPSLALQTGPQPQSALDWFRRADDLTQIRMHGSAPFHLKVTFHAWPGVDFAKAGKSDIVTGNGSYEEWWRSPEQWRREVTLATYHGVEVRAGGVRKMQASSDYEPSRVLMLMDALLSPVPRRLLEPQLEKRPLVWTVSHMSVRGIPWVRLSAQWEMGNNRAESFAYNFLPSGILIRADDDTSMMTGWEGFRAFAGKVVPGRVTVRAMGRDLLTADLTIDPLAPSCPIVQLAGPPAQPGTTLRPLQWWEVKTGFLDNTFAILGNPYRIAFREIMDRAGKAREVEVLAADDINAARAILPHVREDRVLPPTIDGSPCEYASGHIF